MGQINEPPTLGERRVPAGDRVVNEATLDDLLIRWHQWPGQGVIVGRGFNRRAIVVGDFRVSRQYDDQNGALDADMDDEIMGAVDHEVCEMQDPFRAAIYANARALVYGCAVFSSRRLPVDRESRLAVIETARQQLIRRLLAAGVM